MRTKKLIKKQKSKNQVLKNGLRTYLVPLTPITFLNSYAIIPEELIEEQAFIMGYFGF
jgi:hypothetical protein